MAKVRGDGAGFMTNNRDVPMPPRWMSDARIRRMMTDQIKRRRAKRRREFAAFENAVRAAEQSQQSLKTRSS